MRLTDIVIASVVLGVALGVLFSGQPSAAGAPGVTTDSRTFCERITWLKVPAMRRSASLQ